jgi:hypothetical protein
LELELKHRNAHDEKTRFASHGEPRGFYSPAEITGSQL